MWGSADQRLVLTRLRMRFVAPPWLALQLFQHPPAPSHVQPGARLEILCSASIDLPEALNACQDDACGAPVCSSCARASQSLIDEREGRIGPLLALLSWRRVDEAALPAHMRLVLHARGPPLIL